MFSLDDHLLFRGLDDKYMAQHRFMSAIRRTQTSVRDEKSDYFHLDAHAKRKFQKNSKYGFLNVPVLNYNQQPVSSLKAGHRSGSLPRSNLKVTASKPFSGGFWSFKSLKIPSRLTKRATEPVETVRDRSLTYVMITERCLLQLFLFSPLGRSTLDGNAQDESHRIAHALVDLPSTGQQESLLARHIRARDVCEHAESG